MKAAFTLAALALLAACARVTPSPQAPEGPQAPRAPEAGLVYARIGQDIPVDGPRVIPLAVIEDSRCPQKVQCVWAGRVRVSIKVITGRGAEAREITLGERLPVADGTLLLGAVDPPRTREAAIPAGDYRFGFRFDGGY